MNEIKPNRQYRLPNHERFKNAVEKLAGAEMKKITSYVVEGKLSSDTYDEEFRVRYLALHFAANHLGKTAPAFRAMMTSQIYTLLNPIEELIERDRQLIDLHYLFCNHRNRLSLKNPEHQLLLGQALANFDLDKAAEFVMTRSALAKKADKLLAIPQDIQFELNLLRNEEVRKKRDALKDKKQSLSQKVFERQAKSSSRMTEQKARLICDDLLPLLLAKGEPKMAVHFKALVTGNDYDESEWKTEATKIGANKRWLNQGHVGSISW